MTENVTFKGSNKILIHVMELAEKMHKNRQTNFEIDFQLSVQTH